MRPARIDAHRWVALRVPLASFALLAACASEPPPRFHTLVPLAGAANAASVASSTGAPDAAPRAWSLQSLRLPVQVDRPQLVLQGDDGSLAVLEQERWIAPLSDELQAGLDQALQRRLGLPDAGAADGWRIDVDVQRFESVLGREARLEARWSVQSTRAGAGPGQQCLGRFVQPAAGGFPALAAAHRGAVDRLAEAVALSVRADAPGAGARCEPLRR